MDKKKSRASGKSLVWIMLFTLCLSLAIGSMGYMVVKEKKVDIPFLRTIEYGHAPTSDTFADTVGNDTPIDHAKDGTAFVDVDGDALHRRVDFDGLLQRNKSVYGWISIPNTVVDYAVVKEKSLTSHDYLWADIDGKPSDYGSLITYDAPNNKEDAHRVIYGHNLQGSDQMFSTLLKYKDGDYFNAHPDIYMYYPDHAEKWTVWMACNVMVDDAVYEMPYESGSVAYVDVLTHLSQCSVQGQFGRPDATQDTLVLSTCDRSYNGDNGRFIVVCVKADSYDYSQGVSAS